MKLLRWVRRVRWFFRRRDFASIVDETYSASRGEASIGLTGQVTSAQFERALKEMRIKTKHWKLQ